MVFLNFHISILNQADFYRCIELSFDSNTNSGPILIFKNAHNISFYCCSRVLLASRQYLTIPIRSKQRNYILSVLKSLFQELRQKKLGQGEIQACIFRTDLFEIDQNLTVFNISKDIQRLIVDSTCFRNHYELKYIFKTGVCIFSLSRTELQEIEIIPVT